MEPPSDPRLRLKRSQEVPHVSVRGTIIASHFWYEPSRFHIPRPSRLDLQPAIPFIYDAIKKPAEIEMDIEPSPQSPDQPISNLPTPPVDRSSGVQTAPISQPLPSPAIFTDTRNTESPKPHRPSKRVRFNSTSETESAPHVDDQLNSVFQDTAIAEDPPHLSSEHFTSQSFHPLRVSASPTSILPPTIRGARRSDTPLGTSSLSDTSRPIHRIRKELTGGQSQAVPSAPLRDKTWAVHTWRNSQSAQSLEPQALPRRGSKAPLVTVRPVKGSGLSHPLSTRTRRPPTDKHIDTVLETLTGQRSREAFKIPRRRFSEKVQKQLPKPRKKRCHSSDSWAENPAQRNVSGIDKLGLSSELFDGDLSDLSEDESDVSGISSRTEILKDNASNASALSQVEKLEGELYVDIMDVDEEQSKPSSKGRAVRKQLEARKSLVITLQEAAKRQLDCKFWSYVSDDDEEEPAPIPTEAEVLKRPRLTRSGRRLD